MTPATPPPVMNGVLEAPVKVNSKEDIKETTSSTSLVSESSYRTFSESEKEDFMEDPINPGVMSDIGSTKIKVVCVPCDKQKAIIAPDKRG